MHYQYVLIQQLSILTKSPFMFVVMICEHNTNQVHIIGAGEYIDRTFLNEKIDEWCLFQCIIVGPNRHMCNSI